VNPFISVSNTLHNTIGNQNGSFNTKKGKRNNLTIKTLKNNENTVDSIEAPKKKEEKLSKDLN
jgi:hypothetical protein